MKSKFSTKVALQVYSIMCQTREMTKVFDHYKTVIHPYPYATSRGHEAIQITVGLQLQSHDLVFPYYRDDAMLIAMGISPYDLMLQLLAKGDDPFSNGYTYYSHPSLRVFDKPLIPHQSSATGMQAIPAVGAALGLRYKKVMRLEQSKHRNSLVLCSLGDGAFTEGEVSEALQVASNKSLPILFLVQDNGWSISTKQQEFYSNEISKIAKGFGVASISLNYLGNKSKNDFETYYKTVEKIISSIRTRSAPILLHAKVPLLTHHTSGVRSDTYRDDMSQHQNRDPFKALKDFLIRKGIHQNTLEEIDKENKILIRQFFQRAQSQDDPDPKTVLQHIYAPTTITKEKGIRTPRHRKPSLMIECVRNAIQEIMEQHPECLLFGQDVGARLGGVFRETQFIGERFGSERVFNTGIQEAFIVGSSVGLSAVGLKPIIGVQFADYLWAGVNQLFTEVSRSNYLSRGKWPIAMVLRVPIGAYRGGGPYHSSSIESVVLSIPGIKVVYPSNGADLKGLFKAAFLDPNPVVMFEHKGLYWSKNFGTKTAKTPEPDMDYIIPLGRGRMVLKANHQTHLRIPKVTIITYGMGVHWSLQIAGEFDGQLDIIDLRTLEPLDMDIMHRSIKKTGRCILITEESVQGSFMQSLAGRLSEKLFSYLKAPIKVIGSQNVPAIPLNLKLEKACLPNLDDLKKGIRKILYFNR